MSKIGRQPVVIPSSVTVTIADGKIAVKGSKGELSTLMMPGITVTVADGKATVTRDSDLPAQRSAHGLIRSLIQNMVDGVSKGFEKKLEMIGVGFRALVQGQNLVLNAGYSHQVIFPIPTDIKISVEENTKIIVKGIDKILVGQVASNLKKLCEVSGVTTRQCNVSLPNSAVFSSVLDMPVLSEKELESAVSFEAKKYVPLPAEEVNVSWSVVSKDPGGLKQKVLLTAVPKIVIQNYLSVFNEAGLEPLVMEIEALALTRCLVGEDRSPQLLVDIGSKGTSVSMVMDGNLQLSRNFVFGGDTITNKIAETLKLSVVRAEQFKRDFGVRESTFLPETIRPILQNLKDEIKRIISVQSGSGVRIGKVKFTGGGSNLPGLLDFFGDIGVPVEFGDTFLRVGFPKSVLETVLKAGPSLSVAVGLALRSEK
jgi:ribosomal protein L6